MNNQMNVNAKPFNPNKRGTRPPKKPLQPGQQPPKVYNPKQDRLDGPRTNALLAACEAYLTHTTGRDTSTIVQAPGVNRLRGFCAGIYNTIYLSREGGKKYTTGRRIAFQPDYDGPKANSYAASFESDQVYQASSFNNSSGSSKKNDCGRKAVVPEKKETDPEAANLHAAESHVSMQVNGKSVTVNHVKIKSVAQNFVAASYDDSSAMMSNLLSARGQQQPCNSPEEAMGTITGVGDGTMLHPKRFGDGSFVQKTISSNILSLTPLNFIPGNTIVILLLYSRVIKAHLWFNSPVAQQLTLFRG
jgi:hypothetical protein